ncbi:MAG TPA: hypothetical protein VMF89_16435 [Polyangiales bacterium]|nr:hypothetical protein [Polyangiales bacterium]
MSELYERLYGIDLVYQPDCYKLCGDAHCCSFARHKQHFRILGKRQFQELPLLPGEYDFMAARGYLRQFGEYERKAHAYPLGDGRALYVDSIVSYRQGGCVCDHDTRPVVCRLYPVLPVMDEVGRLGAIEPFGVYEELEVVAQQEAACQIRSLPLAQLELWLSFGRTLAESPLVAFHLAAYRLAKRHVAGRLAEARKPGENVFAQFEWALLRKRLFDHAALRAELVALADRYRDHWGERFVLPNEEEAERVLSGNPSAQAEAGLNS